MSLALLVGACSTNRRTDDDVDTTPPDTSECGLDDDCGAFEICEDLACVIGDRDDSFETASPIYQASGTDDPNVAQGLIHVAGDVDHYVYTSPGDEWLRIWTQTDEDNTDGLDTVLSVYAPNGTLHHVMDEFGTGSVRTYDSLMNVYLPTPGTWFLKVEDKGTYYDAEPPRGSEQFRYKLGVEAWGSYSTETDSAEDPSIRFEMANGTTIYPWGVVIDAPGDVDYTTAKMPHGDAPFEIWAPEAIPGSSLRARVEVEDADGELVMTKDDVGPDGAMMYFDGYDTTWQVRVSDLRGDQGGGDHWTVLYLRTRSEGYGNPREQEPNNTAGDANPLSKEEVREGSQVTDRSFLQGVLGNAGDEDWWSVDTVGGGTMRLACSSSRFGSTGDVELDLIGPDGAPVATFSDGDDSAPDIAAQADLAAGTHKLRFYEKDGGGGPSVYYRCGLYVDRP
jgi:hypothetical protein